MYLTRTRRFAAYAALILGATLVAPTVAAADPSTGYAVSAVPDRIVLTPTANPQTSQAVSWRVSTDTTDGVLQVEVPGSGTVDFAADRSNDVQLAGWPVGARHFSAVAEGLAPGTDYRYRVGSDAHWSDWATFTTASADEALTFLYFGDAQNDVAATFTPVVDAAFAATPGAKLHLHAGDLINTSSTDSEWGEWFDALGEHGREVNVFATPGNHEYVGDARIEQFRSHFRFPDNGPQPVDDTERLLSEYLGGGTYYTDYQGVRFISMNANTPGQLLSYLPTGSSASGFLTVWEDLQARWLDAVLAENPNRWSVVTFHQPVFSATSGRDNTTLREAWVPVLERHDVDLVLMGHDHAYTRGHLFANDGATPSESTGPVYAVTVAGPKYYDVDSDENSNWLNNGARRVVTANETSTFQQITVDGSTLSYRSVIAAVGDDAHIGDRPIGAGDVGSVLDEFTIEKTAAGKRVVDGPAAR
ncbi:metallophosphoesterase family protein [Rhodococcus triatomae]|uniref:Purple acid Phosphatase, N-terminal domain n=1 Tax=Rhodococcus triatomae TaxID=300028 RepID=A0A1G8M7N8_9NOCA|nr:metallophosphoesterase family protein [Rhodococcus triatomae]QNG18173.1 metallophosphoesterase family protein [Rhodococcus triatomae]QNG22157.1 metallophosphoesterase family protein [Rhodococcus triatomae]SDI63847.1 Purple acid Phosphatase, N-terminal domain [Rhodococcus triatomae]